MICHKSVVVLSLCFFTCSIVFGQENEIEIFHEIKDTRTLGRHYFTLSNTIRSPFILTNARMSLGIGEINDFKYPLLDLENTKFAYLQGDILAALLSFEYQHAVKEWLAVNIGFGLIGRLGTDLASFVQQGANYSTTFDIGWLINIYRQERFVIAANLGLSNGNYSFINVQNFVGDIVNKIPNPSFSASNNVLYGISGIKAAYGLSPFIGFNLSADLGYGETIQRQLDNQWFSMLGIYTDLDFTPLIRTPVSVSLGYLYSSYPRNNNENVFSNNVFLSQISYIGRTNFILGLDINFSRELIGTNDKTAWLQTIMFGMRYLF